MWHASVSTSVGEGKAREGARGWCGTWRGVKGYEFIWGFGVNKLVLSARVFIDIKTAVRDEVPSIKSDLEGCVRPSVGPSYLS